MRITDLLDRRSIDINGSAASKEEALNKVIDLMCKSGKISDRKAYADKVFAREKEGTTGTGEGIAIPHGKCDAVKSPGLAAMVVRGGVDFDSLDGDPVTLIFLIAAPNTKDNVHLDVLSKLSVMLMDDTFAEKLRNAKSADDFLKIIDAADETASIDSYGSVAENAKCNIVAVTGCPTGIAHTYMAAEALEKAAKANGCSITVSYTHLDVYKRQGYTVGTETGKGLITTPVSVASPAEDNTPAPTATSAAPVHEPGYRLVLEAGELRLYNNYNGSLISGTAINETLFPKSDIESLKAGLSFKTLEEALGMMENFLS